MTTIPASALDRGASRPLARFRRSLALTSALVITCAAGPAFGQDGTQQGLDALQQRVAQQLDAIQQQQNVLEQQRLLLLQQQQEIQQIQSAVQGLDLDLVVPASAAGFPTFAQPVNAPVLDTRAAGPGGGPAIGPRQQTAPPATNGAAGTTTDPTATNGTATNGAATQDVNEPPEDGIPGALEPELTIIEDRGGVLLPAGTFVIEPRLEYGLTSNNTVEVTGFTVLPAILIGSFDINESDRETITASLAFRAGITDRLNVGIDIPYVYRNDTITGRPVGTGATEDVTTSLSGNGIGDISATLNYQLNSANESDIVYVANLSATFPTGEGNQDIDVDADGNPTELATGSGYYSVEPSITAIFPTDPLVFFGNLGYEFTFERDGFNPGDVITASIGAGLSLNERASLNFGYEHQIVLEPEFNGAEIPGADTIRSGRLILGGSYRISDSTSINLTFGFGVTEDAPDLSVTFRVPIRFEDIGELFGS
ncbi:MAG: hypothetical protein RLO50_19570 [Azospirillaceae bacterium]